MESALDDPERLRGEDRGGERERQGKAELPSSSPAV